VSAARHSWLAQAASGRHGLGQSAMTQDFRETEIEFYGRCAEILGVAHAFKERFSERTGGQRMPGNGASRFRSGRMFVVTAST
jgi:hypothetical protein